MFQALNPAEPRQTWMLRALTCLISVNSRKLSAYLRMECNYFTCSVELVLPPLLPDSCSLRRTPFSNVVRMRTRSPNFSSPSPLWKVTHCPDWSHLTSKSNFRIRLLLGCHGLESDASRFSVRKDGQSRGDPSCKLCGAALEDATHFISTCTMLEAKRRELLSYAPLQSRDMDLPDPAREPDSFASIYAGN